MVDFNFSFLMFNDTFNVFFIHLMYILFIIVLYFWWRRKQKKAISAQQNQFEKEKAKLLSQQKQWQEKVTAVETENQKLEQKLRDKTKDLLQKAKDDDDKNRILEKLSNQIVEIEKNPKLFSIKIKEIRRMLKNYLKVEDHTFELQMDELHQDFIRAIKQDFSNLSVYELRLCIYLKIGLNSREMAEILNVLPSSINVSRSRLRKKLGLKPKDDLFDFLSQYSS